jgi:hypothetical protein
VYFVSPTRLSGTVEQPGVASRCSVWLLEPDVCDRDPAGVEAAGAIASPTLGPWNVTVVRVDDSGDLPVEASTPDGRSTDTTGFSAPFIRPISAAASARGSPWNPVPKSASTTTSYPSRSSVSSASSPASRRTRAATRPSPPFEPPPQTHAKRRAAGYAAIASRATAAPARSMSSGIDSGKRG